MRLISFIKESFLEYEDFVSLVLFSYGCNMKCSYCYNYSQITDKNSIINESVYSVIDNNTTELTDALVLLGGEPTIYGYELFNVSSYAKRKHHLSVKVFSNGTKPDLLLEGLREGYFDFVSVDFKAYFPTEAITFLGSWENYVAGLEKIIHLARKENLLNKFEVRMTVIPELMDSYHVIERICNKHNVLFHKQIDVRPSYRELGLPCI